MLRILLTRPKKDSDELGEKLKILGFDVFKNPLIKIKKLSWSKDISLHIFDLVIFTSRNALKFFNEKSIKNKQILTVGEGTFKEAKKIGYKKILCSDGSTLELKKLFLERYKGNRISVLHPTSIDPSGDLKFFFEKNGSTYKKLPIYETKKYNSSPQIFKNFFLLGDGVITIFSPKTAESFVENVLEMNLREYCLNKILVVFSEAVKAKVGILKFKKIITLIKPNEENLLYTISKLKVKGVV